MEIKIIETTSNKHILEIPNEDATLCNLLVQELQKDKSVKNAAFKIQHPLTSSPRILIETSGKTDIKTVLSDASKGINKINKKSAEQIKNIR